MQAEMSLLPTGSTASYHPDAFSPELWSIESLQNAFFRRRGVEPSQVAIDLEEEPAEVAECSLDLEAIEEAEPEQSIILTEVGETDTELPEMEHPVPETWQDSATPPETAPTAYPVYRFALPRQASSKIRRQFQQGIEQLQQTNPEWLLHDDPPQPDEDEAYILIHRDQRYLQRFAAYLTSTVLPRMMQNSYGS